MERYSVPSEMMVCDICGKKMRSRGYGNHLLQTHKMKLTQVSEKKRPHVSEKRSHVSEKYPHSSEKRPHVSEKPITVVTRQIVTTKRVYERLPNVWNQPDPLAYLDAGKVFPHPEDAKSQKRMLEMATFFDTRKKEREGQ